jgi:hypothetical protein
MSARARRAHARPFARRTSRTFATFESFATFASTCAALIDDDASDVDVARASASAARASRVVRDRAARSSSDARARVVRERRR